MRPSLSMLSIRFLLYVQNTDFSRGFISISVSHKTGGYALRFLFIFISRQKQKKTVSSPGRVGSCKAASYCGEFTLANEAKTFVEGCAIVEPLREGVLFR